MASMHQELEARIDLSAEIALDGLPCRGEAEKTYADRIVQELGQDGGRTTYTALDVQDEAHTTIFSVPFER